jgi:hypothetical protein
MRAADVMLLLLVAALIGLLVVTYALGHGYGAAGVQKRWDAERAARLDEYSRAVDEARAVERDAQAEMNRIGDDHEDDRRNAARVADDVAADLRAGNLRLRQELSACATDRVSGAAIAAAERDAHTRLRDQIAGAIVRAGRDADNHVRAAQSVIQACQAAGLTSGDGAKP